MAEIYAPDPVDYDDEQNQSDAFKLYEDMPVIAPYSWQHLTISAVQLAAEDYIEQEHLEERSKDLLKKHALAYDDGEPFTALLGIYILSELGDMLLDNIVNAKTEDSQDSYWQSKQKELPVKERFLAALRKKRGYYYD